SFFLSSRRRHTRFSRDWSSDVCSSDLSPSSWCGAIICHPCPFDSQSLGSVYLLVKVLQAKPPYCMLSLSITYGFPSNRRILKGRSEERRVGKECGSSLAAYRWMAALRM